MPDDKKKKFKFPEPWEGDRPPDGEEDSSFGQILDEVWDKTKAYGDFIFKSTNPVMGFGIELVQDQLRDDKKNYIDDVVVPVLSAPTETLKEGISQFGENPIAGGLKVIESIGHLLGTPFAGLDKTLRHHGLEAEANIIAYPFEKVSEGVVLGEQGIQTLMEDNIPGYTVEKEYEAIRIALMSQGVTPDVAYSLDNEKLSEIQKNISSVTQIGAQFSLGGALHKAGGVGKQIGKKFQKKLPVNVDPLGKETRLGLGVEETALVRQEGKPQQRPFIASETGSITKNLTKNEQIQLGEIRLDRDNIVNERIRVKDKIEVDRQKFKEVKGKGVKKQVLKDIKESTKRLKELDEIIDNRNKEIYSYLQEGEVKHIKGLIPEKGKQRKITIKSKQQGRVNAITSKLDVATESLFRDKMTKQEAFNEIDHAMRSTKDLAGKEHDYYIQAKQRRVAEELGYKDWKDVPETLKVYRGESGVESKPITTEQGNTYQNYTLRKDIAQEFAGKEGRVYEYDINKNDIKWITRRHLTKNESEIIADPSKVSVKQMEGKAGSIEEVKTKVEAEGLRVDKDKFQRIKDKDYVSVTDPKTNFTRTLDASKIDAELKRFREEQGQTIRKNKGKGGQLNIMFDPTQLADIVKTGADLVGKGYKSFGKWADQMKKTYGEEISPHLVKLWDMSKVVVKETKDRERVPKQTSEKKFATEKEVSEYRKIYIKRNSPLSKTKESIKETGESLGKTGRQILKPLDTRLREIDPALYRTVKLNDHIKETKIRAEEEIASKLVKPKGKFLKKTMDSKDVADLDLAFKQENEIKVREIAKKYGLTKELNTVINLLNKVGKELGINKEGFYFPRMVRDYKGYATEVYKILNKEPQVKGILDKVLDEYASKKGSKLTVEEEAHIINNAIRGYIPGITLSKFANEFARTVKQVDAKTAQYLHNWDNSLMMYLQEARMKIENRKLLGKKSGEVPEITDKSIGRLIAERKLESSKPFTPEELGEITQILKAGIEPTGVPAWANLIKDVGYTTTLFNYFSSITQLGDIYAPLYRTPLGTLKAGVKMATGRSAVENLKRIGIDVNQIGREFTNPRQRSQFSRFMAKVSLFRWADMGMKKLAVNTYYERYRSLAKQDKLVEGHPAYHRFKQRFGDKADEVINEFKTTPKGELTSRMAFQLWDELDAHQPISRWSLPEKYHTSAAMQLGYQMKTFALRRADHILNESVRVMRNKNLSKTERIQGVKNFFNLMAVVLASEQATGVTKEFIKNLMKQGKFDLEKAFEQTYANPDMHTSILVDNLMGVVLLSRYDLKTIQKDGLLSTLAAKILPITSVADNFTKDMIGGTFPKYTTKSIPLVGTALYEWLLESTKGKKGFNLNFSMPNLPNL